MKIDAFASGVTRKTALTVAIALAMTSLSAHAEDAWVSTHTKAAMLPVAATQTLAASSTAATPVASGYALNMTGSPHIEGAAVTAPFSNGYFRLPITPIRV